MKHGAAGGEAGFGACQQVDADALDEGTVRPQPFDDNDAALHAVRRAGMDDDAALLVADTDPVAVGKAELLQRVGMDQRGRPVFARDAAGMLLKLVLRKERDGAGTRRKGRPGRRRR